VVSWMLWLAMAETLFLAGGWLAHRVNMGRMAEAPETV